jgi:hypothetical protein
VLWEAPDADQLRFRCRIGHAFGAGALLAAQSQRSTPRSPQRCVPCKNAPTSDGVSPGGCARREPNRGRRGTIGWSRNRSGMHSPSAGCF